MTCYLIHLDTKLGSDHPRGGAGHYIGTTKNVDARLAAHRAGVGAKMLAYAARVGIGFDVVRTWDGGREVERQLKRQRNAPKMCPTCNPSAVSS